MLWLSLKNNTATLLLEKERFCLHICAIHCKKNCVISHVIHLKEVLASDFISYTIPVLILLPSSRIWSFFPRLELDSKSCSNSQFGDENISPRKLSRSA